MTQPTTNQRIHQGQLVLDHNNRYCIYEPDRPLSQLITLTCGLVIELFLEESSKWVVGRVEGEGVQDYWCFLRSGGKLALACGMTARYIEPHYSLSDSPQPLSLLTGTDQ